MVVTFVVIEMCLRSPWKSSNTTDPAGKHNRLNHDTPTHRLLNQHYMIYHQIDLHFHVTQTDPEAPWWWQTTAETCRSKHIEYRIGANMCIVLVFSTTIIDRTGKRVGLFDVWTSIREYESGNEQLHHFTLTRVHARAVIKSRRRKGAEHAACTRETRNLDRKTEKKIPRGRSRCRWKVNIKGSLTQCDVWAGFIWLRIVLGYGKHCQQHSCSKKGSNFFTSWASIVITYDNRTISYLRLKFDQVFLFL
jgi:hypothetical protein